MTLCGSSSENLSNGIGVLSTCITKTTDQASAMHVYVVSEVSVMGFSNDTLDNLTVKGVYTDEKRALQMVDAERLRS